MGGPLDPEAVAISGVASINGTDVAGNYTLDSLTSAVQIPVSGYSTFILTANNAFGANSLFVLGTIDGQRYTTISGVDGAGNLVSSLNNPGTYIYPIGGYQFIKVYYAFYISGTITISWIKSSSNNAFNAISASPSGFSVLDCGLAQTTPLGAQSGNNYSLSLSLLRSLRIEQLLSTVPTYQISANNITPATTPTDILTLSGSASKTIRITKIIFTSTQTTAGINNWLIVKRSALNSGGTSSTPTIIPSDSTNPGATAVPVLYSVNPTSLGASVGNVQVQKILSPTPSATTSNDPKIFDFTNSGVDQGIVLRTASELLALNFAGAALPTGLVISVTLQWQEF